jgi:hypothetical protein
MKITLNELMTVAERHIGNLGRAMTRRAFRVACTSGQVHCQTTPLRLRSPLTEEAKHAGRTARDGANHRTRP